MDNISEEFSSIYLEYSSKIKSLCFGYTNSIDEADDLSQETFLSAWKHWDKFNGQSSRTTWIYRIAINKCLTHIKKNESKAIDIKEIEKELAINDEKNENINLLYKAINKLENIDRLIITMFLDELSYKQIAEVLGIRENSVAVRIHRIKLKLTEIFNNYEKI
ncbi:RNA polymerase sigma-70 factor, ECF subfamily [Aquiflexum balticum DSM 16537]|uniref:RNA polymerase sigma-70 factor, ECF subfamily n=1 Tax=Aquiflexum balticum DSM 16537 TaxID=758820 RepID=A0A1W2H4T6_9BACT|nr:RNA polymerase sigma factor [Aquiflexum balticum]SMD43967.1 RNA polymerase sigma-70 factor, ECF subfamily [Aquiflexum balticum DSM 16537]